MFILFIFYLIVWICPSRSSARLNLLFIFIWSLEFVINFYLIDWILNMIFIYAYLPSWICSSCVSARLNLIIMLIWPASSPWCRQWWCGGADSGLGPIPTVLCQRRRLESFLSVLIEQVDQFFNVIKRGCLFDFKWVSIRFCHVCSCPFTEYGTLCSKMGNEFYL